MTVTVSPTALNTTVTAAGGTTAAVTLNVDGEVGAITAVWTSSEPQLAVTSPTSTTTTTFDWSGMDVLDVLFAEITVQVTDSLSRTASRTFIVQLYRIS